MPGDALCVYQHGVVFVSRATGSNVFAFNAETGEQVAAYLRNARTVQHVHAVRSHLYTLSDDGSVKLYNVKTGEVVRDFEHLGQLNQFAFSPDSGQMFTTTTSGSVHHWNTRNAHLLWTTPGRNHPAEGVVVHGNSLFVGYFDGLLRCYDTTSRSMRWEVKTRGGAAKTLAVAPNLGAVLCTSRDGVTAYSLSDGAEKQAYKGHKKWVSTFVVDAARDTLITGDEAGVSRSFVLSSGKLRHELAAQSDSVLVQAIDAASGAAVSGSRDATALLWHPETGKQVACVKGPRSSVAAVSLGNGRVFALGLDATVHTYDLATGKALSTFGKGDVENVIALQRMPSRGVVYLGRTSPAIHEVDEQTQQVKRSFTGHKGGVSSFALTAENPPRLVSGSWDATVRVWDLSSGEAVATIAVAAEVSRVAVHAGTVFVGYENRDGIDAYGLASGQRVWNDDRDNHSDIVLGMQVVRDVLWTSSYDGSVRAWSLADQTANKYCTPLQTLRTPHPYTTLTSVYVAEGVVYSSHRDGVIFRWDSASGEAMAPLTDGHENGVRGMFDDGLGHLITGSRDNTVKVWDKATGRVLEDLRQHGSTVSTVYVDEHDKLYTYSSHVFVYNYHLLRRFQLYQYHNIGQESRLQALTRTYGPFGDMLLIGVLMIVEFAQLASFAFTDAQPWKAPEFITIMDRVRDFGIDLNLAYSTAAIATSGIVLLFLAAFAAQERVENYKFLNPKRTRGQLGWLVLSVLTKVISRPMFLPMFGLLARVYEECDNAPGALVCWSNSHIGLVVGVSIALLLYVPLCFRFLRVGSELESIESYANPFNWRDDVFVPRKSHPLSFTANGATYTLIVIFVKMLLTLIEIYLDFQPIIASAILVVIGSFLLLAAYVLPPYLSDIGCRVRSGLDYGLLWTYIAGVVVYTVGRNTLIVLSVGVVIVFIFGYKTFDRISLAFKPVRVFFGVYERIDHRDEGKKIDMEAGMNLPEPDEPARFRTSDEGPRRQAKV